MTVRATVIFEVDPSGQLTARVDSDDPLAAATLTKALEEFWRADRDSYARENEVKWLRRLGGS